MADISRLDAELHLQNLSYICKTSDKCCSDVVQKHNGMITFKPTVFKHRKRRDGTFPVSIRITFGRQSRYLPTTITATAADLTRGMKIKSPSLIAQSNAICDRLRNEAARLNPFELEGKTVEWVVDRLQDSLRAQDFRLDFFEWGEIVAASKRPSTGRRYRAALNAFARYIGTRQLDINALTREKVIGFMANCESRCKMAWNPATRLVRETSAPISGDVGRAYARLLHHIHEAAKERYNDQDGAIVIQRSPFSGIDTSRLPAMRPQRPQDVAIIQAMIDTPLDDPQRTAIDVFLAGFALMGANLVDLWEAVPPSGAWWNYNRRKTRTQRPDHAPVRCEIPPEIGPILARLGAGRSKTLWLPVVNALGKDADRAGSRVNYGLRRWCEKRGIDVFKYYAGRHTWATLARRSTEKATVDEGLGHVGDFPLADIYAERDWTKAAEANRRVLALFNWKI